MMQWEIVKGKKGILAICLAVLIILLIVCISIKPKSGTDEPNKITENYSDLDNTQEANEDRAEELKRQEEIIKEQQELSQAMEEAEKTVSEVNENGEATVTIINEEKGIHEEFTVHDVVDYGDGTLSGITEDGEVFIHDSNEYTDPEPSDSQENNANINEDIYEIPDWALEFTQDGEVIESTENGGSTSETVVPTDWH